MSCTRGEASPDSQTKIKLFADSGGYCQNPECNTSLFLILGNKEIHIAEMAHIISVGDNGPRCNPTTLITEKKDFGNLILLCPTCHAKIDKADEEYPDSLIKNWKKSHSDKIKGFYDG